jgi:hypothetical protein
VIGPGLPFSIVGKASDLGGALIAASVGGPDWEVSPPIKADSLHIKDLIRQNLKLQAMMQL